MLLLIRHEHRPPVAPEPVGNRRVEQEQEVVKVHVGHGQLPISERQRQVAQLHIRRELYQQVQYRHQRQSDGENHAADDGIRPAVHAQQCRQLAVVMLRQRAVHTEHHRRAKPQLRQRQHIQHVGVQPVDAQVHLAQVADEHRPCDKAQKQHQRLGHGTAHQVMQDVLRPRTGLRSGAHDSRRTYSAVGRLSVSMPFFRQYVSSARRVTMPMKMSRSSRRQKFIFSRG